MILEAHLRLITHHSIILGSRINDLGFFCLLLLPQHLLDISSPFDLAWVLIRWSLFSVIILHCGKVVVVAFRGYATSSLALQRQGRVAFPSPRPPPNFGFWANQLLSMLVKVVVTSYGLLFTGPKVIKASSTIAGGHSWPMGL